MDRSKPGKPGHESRFIIDDVNVRNHAMAQSSAAIRLLAFATVAAAATHSAAQVYPGSTWETKTPQEVGLDAAKLDQMAEYLGGRGCLTRHGYMVFTWGDHTGRGDVASAAKPWYSTFLFMAVEQGKLASLDTKAVEFEPRLGQINANLGYKDKEITFRHFANQISCYGVTEKPGTAFDYNDWQMALFWDTLFLKVFGATYDNVDRTILRPMLANKIGCQDSPTFMAFGTRDRPGRLAVSPRDFCRFGLLYLREGEWNGEQIITPEHARMAVSSPLPLSIPRTQGKAAEMIPGQRSIGSTRVPDDQGDHSGSYSWLWWINGTGRDGEKKWPDGPKGTFACLGHKNGKRGMAVIPELDIVFSWNDTKLDSYPGSPHPLNTALKLIVEAAGGLDPTPPGIPENLSATGGDGPSIALSWDPARDPETGVSEYRIYRSKNTGMETFLKSVRGETEYIDTSVDPMTRYYYQVSAVNGVGMEGDRSVEAEAVSGRGPPLAPFGLDARIVSLDSVLLQWDHDSPDNVVGFKVENLDGTSVLEVSLEEYNGNNTMPTVEPAGSPNSFKPGALVVSDRTDTWTHVPEALFGMDRLLTARNDRLQEPVDRKYVVRVSSTCDVYLPLDPRYNGGKPSWMDAGWTDTGMTSDSSAQAGWHIWKRSGLGPGEIVLGCDQGVFDGVTFVFVPGREWKEIGTTDNMSFVVRGLESETTHTFRVRAFNEIGTSGPSNEVEVTMPGQDVELEPLELEPAEQTEYILEHESPGYEPDAESARDAGSDFFEETNPVSDSGTTSEAGVETRDVQDTPAGPSGDSSGDNGCGCRNAGEGTESPWLLLILLSSAILLQKKQDTLGKQ